MAAGGKEQLSAAQEMEKKEGRRARSGGAAITLPQQFPMGFPQICEPD